MRKILIILILCLFVLYPVYGQSTQPIYQRCPAQRTYDTAHSYLGITEKTVSGKKQIAKFLKSVGLRGDYAWCAAFVSYCLTANDIEIPSIRSAVAKKFITKASYKASDVLLKKVEPQLGWLVIWSRGTTPYGHIEIVRSWNKDRGISIGGNTTPPKGKGLDFNGDGVYEKQRKIEPLNYFRIVSFTEVK